MRAFQFVFSAGMVAMAITLLTMPAGQLKANLESGFELLAWLDLIALGFFAWLQRRRRRP